MEGGVTCGFNHANYNYNFHAKKSKSPLLLFRSTPPFSAINKFLEVAHEKNNSPSKNNNIIDVVSSTTTTTTASTTMDDYGEFSSSSTTNNTLMHENNFVEGLFLDGSNNNNNESTQNSELSHEVEHRNEEINSLPSNNIKGSKEKKSKGFKDMIKGQWTEEEDRMLKTLVLKYGERKWAMIARSYLVGRAGKQCRERWHNHLRPDIKKDAWDEEEERMLVLAHQQFGNKWAEIARRIPGRSENSIKNHWNATKRRQNCRKKSSKSTKVNDNVDHLSSNPQSQSQSQSQPSSILQEYIKARYPSNNKTNHNHPTTTATTTAAVMSPTSTSTNVSVDPPSHIDQYCFDSPTSLTTIVSNPCHEEAIFMQQLFSNENNNNVNNNININTNTNNINYNDPKYYYYYHNYDDEIVDSMIMDSLSFDQHNNDHNNNNNISNNINININNNIYSDKFMANQLDGRSPYDDDHQGGLGGMMVNSQPLDQLDQRCDVMDDEVNNKQGFLAKKKDMDLFEMILSPNFLQSSSSNNNSSYYYYYY